MLLFPIRKAVVCAFVCLGVVTTAAVAQTPSPEWVWINGNKPSASYSTGHQGQMGIPGFSYSPIGRYAAAQWVDASGNLWLFGGFGVDKQWRTGYLNDLWMFNPSTDEWTWVSGSLLTCIQKTCQNSGHYGTKGQADPANLPPARYQSMAWTDKSGHLWLYGGFAESVDPFPGFDNLWMFNTESKLWTWMGGSQTPNLDPVYGTLGAPADSNTPGGIYGGMTWVDGSGAAWLYGGWRYTASSGLKSPAEVWKLNLSTGQWTCLQHNALDSPPTHLPAGDPAANPGSRFGSATWVGADGKLWLFGGAGANGTGSAYDFKDYGDLWSFDPSSALWTWQGGSPNANDPGSYGTKGDFGADNRAPARAASQSWADGTGNLWVLGGSGYTDPFPGDAVSVSFDDLWEFSSSLQQWAWIAGPEGGTTTTTANWGVHRLPAPTNYPGGRSQGAALYDGARAWLFGGYDAFRGGIPQNDLWEFAPVTPAPQYSLPHGMYKTPAVVTITDANPDAVIYYTTDGTVPTFVNPGAKIYTSPVQVNSPENRIVNLKAIAAAPGMAQSIEVWATYKLWPVD